MPKIFTVVINEDKETGGYWAECDMPNGGCISQGETLRETQMKMYEAIELCLDDYSEIKDYGLSFEV